MMCAWCGAVLVDAFGAPSWDLFDRPDGTLAFVCRDRCKPTRQWRYRFDPDYLLDRVLPVYDLLRPPVWEAVRA